MSVRRQPRGCFGSNARLQTGVANTALSPALSGWGLRQRGVDNSIHNAPLSVWGLPNGNTGTILLRLHVPVATVANRSCQQRGGSGPLWVGPTPRPLSITPFTAALCAKRPSNDGSTPHWQTQFTPTGKLKPSYNSARSGLQGSRDPLTGKDVHLGRPLSPVSRKKSRVSRPRSSGKSFHFPRRTFSRSPTGDSNRRFAASAPPNPSPQGSASETAAFTLRDRSPHFWRPQSFSLPPR